MSYLYTLTIRSSIALYLALSQSVGTLFLILLGLSGVVQADTGLCCDKSDSGKCIQTLMNMPARSMPSRVFEPKNYSELNDRLERLNTGNCANVYYLHKTQAWLNFSRDLYHEGASQTSVKAAFTEAEKIVKALEAGVTPSPDASMIQDAAKIRLDLWEIVANRKRELGLSSTAARDLAYCEIYLISAGHAQTNLGGIARVQPLISMAQDICHVVKY
jgi:hypothetical protein